VVAGVRDRLLVSEQHKNLIWRN